MDRIGEVEKGLRFAALLALALMASCSSDPSEVSGPAGGLPDHRLGDGDRRG